MESEDKTSADVREGSPPAPAKGEEPKPPVEGGGKAAEGEKKADDRSDVNKKPAKDKCSKKHSKRKAKKGKKAASLAESSSDSDTDDSGTEASSSEDSESEEEVSKTKRVVKKRQSPQKTKKKTRTKKPKKAAKTHSSDSDSASDSSESDGSDNSDDEANQQTQAELLKQLQLLILQQQQQQQQQQSGGSYGYPSGLGNSMPPPVYDTGLRRAPGRPRRGGPRALGRASLGLGGVDSSQLLDGNQHKEKKRQRASKLDYKRVDQVWDDAIHNYKLQDTAEGTVDAQYEEFIFHVRRTFDWEGKFKSTIVDIKGKLLRESLQDVIGDIKGISLVDDTPKLDPNMLFL
jgi:hypothetical protein